MPKVAVVGGGWSGLAAATELVASGVNVTLFEAGRVLGGRARSTQVGGKTLDNGQHILLGAYTETLKLIRRVGVSPERMFDRIPLRFLDDSGFSLQLPHLPAPLNLGIGLLFARGVGVAEKIQTARWMQSLKAAKFSLDSEMTVAEWLDTVGQVGELRHRLWGPLCLAALNTRCEQASAQIFANVLRDSLGSACRESTDILIPRRALGELLPEPAQTWLLQQGARICLGHRVRQIGHGGGVDGEMFDAVVVAVAPQHASALLPSIPQPASFEPIATIYLEYADNTMPSKFPLACVHTEIGPVWIVARTGNKSEGFMVAGVISGTGAWENYSDAELCREIQAGIVRLNRTHSSELKPRWAQVIREKRATFSCTPNLPRSTIKTDIPHVWQVGDHTWAEYPATLEGAVRSGLFAARQIISSFQ